MLTASSYINIISLGRYDYFILQYVRYNELTTESILTINKFITDLLRIRLKHIIIKVHRISNSMELTIGRINRQIPNIGFVYILKQDIIL